ITASTEIDTLGRLLALVCSEVYCITRKPVDEVVILLDSSAKDNQKTLEILRPYQDLVVTHPLNNNYGAHKNFGVEQCKGQYVFQIDGDELPPETLLGENLDELLDSNPDVEAYAVPRINDFRGVTVEHANQWGWQLTTSAKFKRPIVNFPDPQWRIFKRDPRIRFKGRLHEKIEGFNSYTHLPASEEYALYHDKTIETQIKTNLRYNQMFTQAENMGLRGTV